MFGFKAIPRPTSLWCPLLCQHEGSEPLTLWVSKPLAPNNIFMETIIIFKPREYSHFLTTAYPVSLAQDLAHSRC